MRTLVVLPLDLEAVGQVPLVVLPRDLVSLPPSCTRSRPGSQAHPGAENVEPTSYCSQVTVDATLNS